MHDLQPFTDLALVFTVAVGVALAVTPLRLPPVLAYLAVGCVLGPPVLGVVGRGEELALVAEIGVVLLLFTVGLEFSIRELRRSWRFVVLAGALQVVGTVAAVAIAASLMGRSAAVAVAAGLLVAPSSTAVVLRLLDARGESRAAHGRLILGILVFQDLCVVPMLLAMPLLAGEGGGLGSVAVVLVKAVGIVILTGLLSQKVVPPLFHLVARSRNREVFLLAVLGVAGSTAWVVSWTGLPLALGAFVAGMVLAETDYAHQALTEVLPFRTVTMCVFFVGVGMLLDVGLIGREPMHVAALGAGIWAIKVGVTWAVGVALRVPVRVAGLAAVALAQAGEFSFVLTERGTGLGLIADPDGRAFLAASVLTIAATPITMALFPRFLAGSKALDPLERWLDPATAEPDVHDGSEPRDHVIVAGFGACGQASVKALETRGIPAVVVELNPATVAEQRAAGRWVVYGDASSPEVLAHAGLARARAVVLVPSDAEAAHRAVGVIRETRPDIPILLRTRYTADEEGERGPGIEVFSDESSAATLVARALIQTVG